MKVLILTAGVLLLVGCEHAYGGFDGRLSDAQAIQVARTDARGASLNPDRWVPSVVRGRDTMQVRFDLAQPCNNCVGGGVVFTIDPKTRQVSSMLLEQ